MLRFCLIGHLTLNFKSIIHLGWPCPLSSPSIVSEDIAAPSDNPHIASAWISARPEPGWSCSTSPRSFQLERSTFQWEETLYGVVKLVSDYYMLRLVIRNPWSVATRALTLFAWVFCVSFEGMRVIFFYRERRGADAPARRRRLAKGCIRRRSLIKIYTVPQIRREDAQPRRGALQRDGVRRNAPVRFEARATLHRALLHRGTFLWEPIYFRAMRFRLISLLLSRPRPRRSGFFGCF